MGWESTDLKVRARLDRHGGKAEQDADREWAEFEAALRDFVASARPKYPNLRLEVL